MVPKSTLGRISPDKMVFAAGGDYYLGQLLSLKDPNSLEFDTSCPNWKDPNAPIVLDALELTFGRIYAAHGKGELRFFYMLSTLKYNVRCTPTFCEAEFIANRPSPTKCQIEKKDVWN